MNPPANENERGRKDARDLAGNRNTQKYPPQKNTPSDKKYPPPGLVIKYKKKEKVKGKEKEKKK